MTDEVKFDEEEIVVDTAASKAASRGSTGLTDFMMKIGLAKTESQSTYILITIMVICFVTTLFVITRYII